MKKIVIIGGGTGTYTLLSGLKKYPVDLSVIVSTADDGGSTGKLRKELGVMPPGDIRQCLLGLSSADEETKGLFAYRFSEGSLKGHVAGNIIIAAMEKLTGSIELSVEVLAKILEAKGKVLPVTLKPTTLSAILENGKTIRGEHNIDERKTDLSFKIKDLKLSPAPANPKALKAILSADAIVFGPGDLYTSILPNLLVKGVAEAIKKSRAKKIFITNIMTKQGQSDGFSAGDFIKEFQKYLYGKIDVALVNKQKPANKWINAYKRERGFFVDPTVQVPNVKVVEANLISEFVFKRASSDKLKRSFLRHDSRKLAAIIWKLL